MAIKLGSIISIKKGKKHSIVEGKTDNSKRLLSIVDLRHNNNIVFTNDKKGTEVKPNDVMIAWDGANAGTIGFGKSGLIGSTIARLQFNEQNDFDANYVGSFLKTKFDYLRKTATGATIPHISRAALESIIIPEFLIDDQIRIATLLSRIESLIATRKENLILLDDFLKNTFLEMFGDPVRNEKEWDKRSINSFSKVRIGPFGSLLHAEDYVVDGIPLINPSHIINGKIKPNFKLSLTEEKYQELNNYHLKKNDVVVARRGEIGRCAIVLKDEKLFCGTGSMFIRIDNNYSPVFLQFQIFNTTLCNYLESKAKGVTMKNLNSKVLGNLKVLVPPDELMNKFIRVINKIELIKSLYQKNLTELENLYGAVSQKAFKGELDLSSVPIPDKNIQTKDISTDASKEIIPSDEKQFLALEEFAIAKAEQEALQYQ